MFPKRFGKNCREKQNKYFMVIFSPENRAVDEIMWKNILSVIIPVVWSEAGRK
jgi:hypothetical protein